MVKRYSCTKDDTSRTVTFAVIILFIAEGVFLSTVLFNKTAIGVPLFFRFMIVLLPWFILLVAYVYSVTGLSIDEKFLWIERPIGPKKILLTDIREAGLIDKKEMKGTVRGFGNGGIFGYYGKFFNAKYGTMTWYVTRRDRLILLRMNNNAIILISPDEPSVADLLKKSNPSV
ncbi:MAG: hypothetical protein FJZ78_08705 [Bacteroidetes bacterium]|nr:hypothetical protein [Bacteroidota bacterium]